MLAWSIKYARSMFVCTHHLVCGCCFTLRRNISAPPSAAGADPPGLGGIIMRIRELFLFIICLKLVQLYFFLYKSCDFIVRMHFVILQGMRLLWRGSAQNSHFPEHLKISARYLAPMIDPVCYHGS